MLGFTRWSMSAMVLATACGFDSGGVPGSSASGASIGSNDTSGTTEGSADSDDPTTASSSASTTSSPSTTATTDPDSGMTMDPGTATTNPTNETGDESTGPMVAETGTDASQGSLDSSPPLDTGETLESTDAMTEESGVIPPDAPYYENCDEQADCGVGGECLVIGVQDAPDAHVCLVPCGMGCPDPIDGTATPVCTSFDWCMLSCQQSADCPTDMSCYIFNGGQKNEFRRCLWSQG